MKVEKGEEDGESIGDSGKVRVASNITLFNPLSFSDHIRLSAPFLNPSHPIKLVKD